MIVAMGHNQKKARLPNFLGAVSLANLTSELTPLNDTRKEVKMLRKNQEKTTKRKKLFFSFFSFVNPCTCGTYVKEKNASRARVYILSTFMF